MAKNLYFFELLLSIHLFNLLIEHASSRGLGLGHRDLLTDLRVRLNFCPAPTLPRTPLRWSRSCPATTKTLETSKEIDFLYSRSLWLFHIYFIYLSFLMNFFVRRNPVFLSQYTFNSSYSFYVLRENHGFSPARTQVAYGVFLNCVALIYSQIGVFVYLIRAFNLTFRIHMINLQQNCL